MAAPASFSPSALSSRHVLCGKGHGSSSLTFVAVTPSYYHAPVRNGGEADEYSLPFMCQELLAFSQL